MSSKRKQGSARKSEEMFQLMRDFENSDQPQRMFWESHGLARSTFQYWWRRYRQWKQGQPSEQADFVPLVVRPASPTLEAGILITYTDGIRVEVPTQVGALFIRQLLDR